MRARPDAPEIVAARIALVAARHPLFSISYKSVDVRRFQRRIARERLPASEKASRNATSVPDKAESRHYCSTNRLRVSSRSRSARKFVLLCLSLRCVLRKLMFSDRATTVWSASPNGSRRMSSERSLSTTSPDLRRVA
jgi:hypothetical protein